MNEAGWLAVPVGPDSARWMTRSVRKKVLVVAHTFVSTQRLLDVVRLVETDPRVQLTYTAAPDVFGTGVPELLRGLGALEIPWRQATYDRFDLALAAAYGGIAQLHAPVMVLPHGAGYAKPTPAAPGRPADRGVYGLMREHLVRDGRVVPASIVLSHQSQLALLARHCPAAAEVAVVAGDPCYDRLLASGHLRQRYRDTLGTGDRTLVAVASTWGPHSLFGRHGTLLSSLVRQLDPARYQVAALIHPAAWSGHGRRQIRAWLDDECAAGLTLIEPEGDWRAAVIAADHLIGDHGSVAVYAASIGVPVLHTDLPLHEVDGTAPQAYVGARAPLLVRSAPVEPQLARSATALDAGLAGRVAARLTSRPGRSHRLLREEMYRLLDMDMPGRHRAVEPVEPVRGWRRG